MKNYLWDTAHKDPLLFCSCDKKGQPNVYDVNKSVILINKNKCFKMYVSILFGAVTKVT